jgi:hypothetical protein
MSTPLVVPIDVEALVVTKAYQKTQALRRWPFNYNALGQYDSPEPRAGQGQSSLKPPDAGVHLRWTLPAALRRGVQTPAPAGGVQTEVGDVTYPPVPNRWLIVRLAGAGARQATAWVLESDCPNADSPTQYLVDAGILAAWRASGDRIRSDGADSVVATAQGGPPVAPLGQAFPAAGWAERAATATFLTAVAPGNATFSAYQPHHDNVFAFTDPLDGVGDDQLTYVVTGWWSNPAEDPLGAAARGDPDTVRTAFGWTLPDGADGSGVDATLLHGLAFDVPWAPGATSAPPSPLDDLAGRVSAAIGMTDVDALTALITAQPGARGPDASVLQAFQYGLLSVFEQVNGPALLARAVHQAGFATQPGGTRWTIAPASAGPGEDPGASAALTDAEARWLLALNADQDALDAAVLARDSVRWALYAMWWKYQKGLAESVVVPVDGFDPDAYRQVVETTLPAAIAAAESAVTTALAAVPQPAPQAGDTREQAFTRGVAAFARTKGLDDNKVLKAVPGPRYWRATDPVVLLSGLTAPAALDPSAPAACRLAGDGLVAALVADRTTVTAATLGAVVPAAPASAAPAACAALLAEAFLLDAASAPAIAGAARIPEADVAAAIGTRAAPAYDATTLPALGLDPWRAQPWAPLFLEWQVDHLDIPYATGGAPNWAFDGDDYAYTGPFGPFPADPQAPLRAIGGISLLTPQTQYTFRRRLEQFLDVYLRNATDPPATLAELKAIDAEVETIDGWRLMSQALTGFGDLVAMRDTRAHIAPDATVAGAVAGQTNGVPVIDDGSPGGFSAVRQGQFAFTSLLVYDAFGQVLQVVGGTGLTDPQTFAPVREPALLPTRPAITRNPQRLVQVPPRVMQPARLEFLLVDAGDDTRVVGTSAGANPIGGWVLPNHLDRSLLLYAPDGTALGSFRRLAGEDGTATAAWQAPPHSALTLDDVRARAPRVAAMIGDPALADPPTFGALLDTIDATLWTIDPLGNRADVNLSVLIGRPLALVRARLDLALDGPPIGDLSPWENVWPPPEADFTSADHAVRLGDLATRSDGLIGYFAGEDTAPFNTVPPPGAGGRPGYLRQIGPVGATKDTNYFTLRFGPGAPRQAVTMLVDPRAAVTATTGMLPAKTLTIPPAFVDGPLAALEIAFTANALPTTIVPTPGTTPPPANPLAVGLPLPIEQGGTWAWWERSAGAPGGWASFDLARATPGAALTDLPTTVRDGYLQLTADLAPPTPPPEGGD